MVNFLMQYFGDVLTLAIGVGCIAIVITLTIDSIKSLLRRNYREVK